MRIALIGGSGFIGSYLVPQLMAAGHEVRIIDKSPSVLHPDKYVMADIRDKEALTRALASVEVVYNLAAEHKDNVQPKSLYSDVNVGGARNLVDVIEALDIRHLIFTSSVAVYGLASQGKDEDAPGNPINEYGRTKWEAEKLYLRWQQKSKSRTLTVVRPTVVFGPRNRGNVFNLIRQIASRRFIMIGSGENRKSMAFVENVAAFLQHALSFPTGCHIYNYVDKPDLTMNDLVQIVRKTLFENETRPHRLPYFMGYAGGLCFDVFSMIAAKEFPISSVRVRKFCATTVFDSSRKDQTGFRPPYDLVTGIQRTLQYEFGNTRKEDDVLFFSE